jgi:hypothetical protein
MKPSQVLDKSQALMNDAVALPPLIDPPHVSQLTQQSHL